MGIIKIGKANVYAVKKHNEFESVVNRNDNNAVKNILEESVSMILSAGLTKNQFHIIESARTENPEGMRIFFEQAFWKGWTRAGSTSLSNAMDEVLLAAQSFCNEVKAAGNDSITNGAASETNRTGAFFWENSKWYLLGFLGVGFFAIWQGVRASTALIAMFWMVVGWRFLTWLTVKAFEFLWVAYGLPQLRYKVARIASYLFIVFMSIAVVVAEFG